MGESGRHGTTASEKGSASGGDRSELQRPDEFGAGAERRGQHPERVGMIVTTDTGARFADLPGVLAVIAL